MLYPAIEYKICYNLAVFIPMKTAKSFIFIIFVAEYCLIREKVVTFRMVKLNLLLSIFCITK